MWRKPRPSGPFVLALSDIELGLLSGLLTQLTELAVDPVAGDPVLARLYPAAYADEAASAEFRELTESSLTAERLERYRESEAELAALPPDGGQLVIGPDDLQRWLMVFNDLRLALGTRLAVTAEGFDEPDGSGPPEAEVQAGRDIYHWLTAVQDGLVTQALG